MAGILEGQCPFAGKSLRRKSVPPISPRLSDQTLNGMGERKFSLSLSLLGWVLSLFLLQDEKNQYSFGGLPPPFHSMCAFVGPRVPFPPLAYCSCSTVTPQPETSLLLLTPTAAIFHPPATTSPLPLHFSLSSPLSFSLSASSYPLGRRRKREKVGEREWFSWRVTLLTHKRLTSLLLLFSFSFQNEHAIHKELLFLSKPKLVLLLLLVLCTNRLFHAAPRSPFLSPLSRHSASPQKSADKRASSFAI